jgi:hypothetical protein
VVVADNTDSLKCDEECAEAKSDEMDWDNFDVDDPTSFLEKSGLDKVLAHLLLVLDIVFIIKFNRITGKVGDDQISFGTTLERNR